MYWAMDAKAPKSISATGGRVFIKDETETPDAMDAVLEYPGFDYTFSLRSTPFPGFENMGSIGCVFEGTDATLVTNYSKHEVHVDGKLVEDFPITERIPDSPGHVREFLDAIKSRNLETTCNVRYGHKLSKAGLLTNIAYRTGERLYWDDDKEQFIGNKKASAMLHRQFRKPWSLKVQPRPVAQPGGAAGKTVTLR
jgi:hypothetical protein